MVAVAAVTATGCVRLLLMLLRANPNDCGEFGVSGQWFMVLQIHLTAVLKLPAGTAKISKDGQQIHIQTQTHM